MGLFFRGLCKHCDTCDSKKAKTPVMCARTRACEQLEALEELEALEGLDALERLDALEGLDGLEIRVVGLCWQRVAGGGWHFPFQVWR